MKGERLFVERQTELLEQLAEEKDMAIKFKLAFLKCFSPLGRDGAYLGVGGGKVQQRDKGW